MIYKEMPFSSKKPLFLLYSILIIIIIFIMFLDSQHIYFFPKVNTLAVWNWNSPTKYTNDEYNNITSQLSNESINTIYFNISEIIDISEIKDLTERLKKQDIFDDRLTNIINISLSKNIHIQGLSGNPNWVKDEYKYLFDIFFKYITIYNSTHNNKLEGMQFDLEPYSLPDFAKNKEVYLRNYLNIVDNATQKAKNLNIKIGFTVPFWIQDISAFPSVKWNNKENSFYISLLELLNNSTGSYLAIMDYRNYTYGGDGSINNIKDFMNIVEKKYINVKTIIGQEVGGVTPSKVTFYNMSKNQLKKATTELNDVYNRNKNFDGFAINDLDNYIIFKN